jgi:predicted phosphodiesterase
VSASQLAGRFCPPDYRIDQRVFLRNSSLGSCDVLYVVGGLYGNTEALQLICSAFEAEPSTNKALVFNGDFHWFDVAEAEFAHIEAITSKYVRLRGNVETELTRAIVSARDDVGCGCAYPEEVDDGNVAFSNAIIQQLRKTYLRWASNLNSNLTPKLPDLLELPMAARFDVGGLGVAVTHGDIDSLAGWTLAHNRIRSTLDNGLSAKLSKLDVSVVACSHTCLPALCSQNNQIVVNNGAAGLANFMNQTSGLVTRVAVSDHAISNHAGTSLPLAYESHVIGKSSVVHVQALDVPFNDELWQEKFLSQWPIGSAAYESYWKRIQLGTSYTLKQARQYEY